MRVESKHTQPINITKGVLQGDPISPLLFSIFISDIEEYFRSKELKGINMSINKDIIMLLYADDLVNLASSPADVSRKLRALESYCSDNALEINASKTKLYIFTKVDHQR